MKKVLLFAIMAIGILAAGCSRETGNEGEEGGIGSLTFTLTNERAGSTTRATGAPTLQQENTVFEAGIYVFNSTTDLLEKSQIFSAAELVDPNDPDKLKGTITGLTTSSRKKVVVLINYNFNVIGDGQGNVTEYNELFEEVINLDSQYPDDFSQYGLFMSGELDDILLTSGQTTPITIYVERVVAKVRLLSLTVSPDADSDLSQFTITSVSMQKVPYWAYMLGNDIPDLDDSEYYGGIAGSVSSEIGDNPILLLTDYTPTITSGVTLIPNIYFYVLPNDDSNNNITLLTIAGTYEGNDAYYTFPINNRVVAGGTDGTFIKRNTIYDLNVTLRSLSNFATDPDDDSLAGLEITIEIMDWNATLTQNVEW